MGIGKCGGERERDGYRSIENWGEKETDGL